ncbi:ArsR/SmtB family transcription factor [Bacillus testis]|uniref:ArsR/SmtB family transcription factor n=1 Tax=Bacillus testis TaxID=1622072 RepID=UPI000A619A85|nr:winged helix-turn-helix domain-containing protein [Bacillus testis]
MKLTPKIMDIDLVQQKLVSSPLRVKILYLLAEKAMTAKQVADELGKSPGSIHYHIQQLYNGGILHIEETKMNKGIVEKYYRPLATHFRLKDEPQDYLEIQQCRRSYISLSEEELEEFNKQFDSLLERFVEKTLRNNQERTSYEINCIFKKVPIEEEDEWNRP